MEVPWIFLSHSGKQKDFARTLYAELVQAGHHPFFDQDAERSLPKGHPFPGRIVDACRGCKMGIVVLSHDYMESMWPMLELEQLCFHNPSVFICPLFYKLQPVDLSTQLTKWQSRWNSRASEWPSRVQACFDSSPSTSFAIDMSSWPAAVNKLKYQNGEVLPNGMEDHAWIQKIVSNICKTLPPPQLYLLGHHIQGGDRITHKIDQLFDELPSKANGVIPLGVHGKGKSGKTTLCKTMANFYNKDFPGRSSWLEFPSEENEKELVEAIKNTLPIVAQINKEDLKRICSIEEAMSRLEEGLKRHRVFLCIDNVWNWSLENARQIIRMKYSPGSKVMVTSRSEKVLLSLVDQTNVVHVPSISQEEAIQVLLSHSNESRFSHEISEEDLRNLAESCFNEEGECDPLSLTMIGAGLRQVGGQGMDDHDRRRRGGLKAFTSKYLEACCMHGVEDITQLIIGLGTLLVVRHLTDLYELATELRQLRDLADTEIDQLETGFQQFVDTEIETGFQQFVEIGLDQLETQLEKSLTWLSSLFDE